MCIINDKVYSLYSLSINPDSYHTYRFRIYTFLKKLKFEYRQFDKWYDSLFDEDNHLIKGREIIICEDLHGIILGVAILKNSMTEKKICTLRVGEKFQYQGIGTQLVKMSIDELGVEKPMITINKNKLKQFKKLFDKYNFELTQTKKHYYGIFNTELVFNGTLPDKKLFNNFK